MSSRPANATSCAMMHLHLTEGQANNPPTEQKLTYFFNHEDDIQS